MNKDKSIPKTVLKIIETLQNSGFEAYVVGGCVRDIILEKDPKDWDITTNATPEKIQSLFEHTAYENTFGTVCVINDNEKEESLKVIEITPYRKDGKYTDKRHPEKITFSKTLDEDLKRRDFTINAMALDPSENKLIDNFNGINDIAQSTLKVVGNAKERFSEDALRLLRAVRIATELDFSIDKETALAIQDLAETIKEISIERVRDEFIKIIKTKNPMRGVILLNELGLLQHIIPEVELGIGVEQNQAHRYDVYEHNLRTLQHSADKDYKLEIRTASLFHDIAKPHTKEWNDKNEDWSFHAHEVVGAKITDSIMKRMKFSKKFREDVVLLVRWHMFFSDPDKLTLSGVRRMVGRVGEIKIWDLIDLRKCDRIGTGRPKEQPYRLRKFVSMVEEVIRDPVSVKMLKINGQDLMKIIKEEPGRKIGYILSILLEKVLENKDLNTEKDLEGIAKELAKKSEKELEEMSKAAKDTAGELNEKEIKDIRDKYFVN